MATTSNTVGLNDKGLDKIKEAIKSYKNKVNKACNISAKKATIEAAIKGTSTEAELKKYLNQMETDLKAYLDALDMYADDFNAVKQAYAKNDKDSVFAIKYKPLQEIQATKNKKF